MDDDQLTKLFMYTEDYRSEVFEKLEKTVSKESIDFLVARMVQGSI